MIQHDELVWQFEAESENDLILNHPVMLPQATHKQLGQIVKIIEAASHTRLDHSGYTRKVAREICKVLKQKGRLPAPENDIIQAAALHDLGHPPFSHAVEYDLKEFENGKTHHEKALELLESDLKDRKGRTIKDILELYDADPERVKKLLRGEDPASKIFTDKSLGADKLAYTAMDAIKCGFYTTPPNWKNLVKYISFFRDGIAFDISTNFDQLVHQIDLLTQSQDTYLRLYTGLYLTSKSLALERHIQKAVEFAIKGNILTPQEIWSMADDTLVSTIRDSKEKNDFAEISREALSNYWLNEPYVSVVCLKYDQFKIDRFSEETVMPIESEFVNSFLDTFQNPLRLTELESELTKMLSVPLLVSVLPDPQKVKPGIVYLYRNGTYQGLLKDLVPEHYQSLEEKAARSFAIRILVPTSERETMSRKHKEIRDSFFEVSEKYIAKTQQHNLEKTLDQPVTAS